MVLHVESGWWLIPFIVSVVGFFFAFRINGASSGSFGSAFFSMVNYLILFVVPSLIAWLIWALLR